MEKKYFGKMKDGTDVYSYTLKNKNGMAMTLIDLGATLTGLLVPDREGNLLDVVLGYDTPQEYVDNGCFFSAVIGRCCNRTDKGRFVINGKTYQLAINDNENNLHSAFNFYHARKWWVKETDETKNSITFELFSPDGDQGYPGNFRVSLTYTLTEDNEIVLHYQGESDADTVANLTNHAYFNLNGHDSGRIEDHILKIYAENYTPVRDYQSIPTGEIAPVAGTPLDFTQAKPVGRDIEADFDQLKMAKGFDHNFALSAVSGEKKKMAEAYSEKTGIFLEAYTDMCGMQFYAGNCIDEHPGKGGAHYGLRTGFCLEAHHYPNAINQEGFESPLLKAGEKYDTTTSYKFSVK